MMLKYMSLIKETDVSQKFFNGFQQEQTSLNPNHHDSRNLAPYWQLLIQFDSKHNHNQHFQHPQLSLKTSCNNICWTKRKKAGQKIYKIFLYTIPEGLPTQHKCVHGKQNATAPPGMKWIEFLYNCLLFGVRYACSPYSISCSGTLWHGMAARQRALVSTVKLLHSVDWKWNETVSKCAA